MYDYIYNINIHDNINIITYVWVYLWVYIKYMKIDIVLYVIDNIYRYYNIYNLYNKCININLLFINSCILIKYAKT